MADSMSKTNMSFGVIRPGGGARSEDMENVDDHVVVDVMPPSCEVCLDQVETTEVDMGISTVMITKSVAPDGGFGWVVAVMSFFVTFILTGFLKSYGVLRPAIIEEFPDTTATVATWISGLIGTLSLLASPVTGNMMASFGHRILFSTGAALCSLGLGVSFFAPSGRFLMASLGLCMGFGSSFLITSAVGCTGKLFTTRKPTAMTIALSGGCVGSFVMPFILSGLLGALGLRYTFLVMSGLFLLLTLSCFFYGDPEKHFVTIEEEVALEDLEKDEAPKEEAKAPTPSLLNRLRSKICETMGLAFLNCPIFILTASCIFAASMGTPHFLGSAPAQAKSIGIDAASAALLTYITRSGDWLARLVYGMLASKSPFHRSAEFVAALLTTAICALLVTFCTSFWQLAVLAGISSFASGVWTISIPLVLSANHGATNMASTLNLVRWCQGMSGIIYRFAAAIVRSNAGLTVLLLCNGTSLAIAAVLSIAMYILKRRQN